MVDKNAEVWVVGDIVKATAPNTDIWTGDVEIDRGDLFKVMKVAGDRLSLQPLNTKKYADDLIGVEAVHFARK